MEQSLNEEQNQFYLFCFLTGNDKLNVAIILTSIFVFVNTTIILTASYMLLKNKEKFPIMERSPLLSVVALFFANLQVSGQALMALIQAHEDLLDFRDVDLVDDIGVLVFSLSMIFRIIRLYYAFKGTNISQQSKLKMRIYGSQVILAAICIISSVLLALIPYYIEHDQNIDKEKQQKIHLTYKICLLSITTIIILAYGRYLRIMTVNFNLVTESFLLVFQLVILINFKFWIYVIAQSLYKSYKNIDCITENIDQLLNLMFLYTLVINIALIPLRKKRNYHEILPPSLILDEFSIFIANNQNVVVFYDYLKNLDSLQFSYLDEIPQNLAENLNQIQKGMNYEEEYFHRNMLIFYLDFYGKSINEKEKHYNMEILESLFPITDLKDQLELSQTFFSEGNVNMGRNATYLEEPLKKPVDNPQLVKFILEKNLTQVKFYLDNLYKEHFQKTKSFSVIQNQFQFNEQVAINLFNLNMTKLNRSLLETQDIKKIKYGSVVDEDDV